MNIKRLNIIRAEKKERVKKRRKELEELKEKRRQKYTKQLKEVKQKQKQMRLRQDRQRKKLEKERMQKKWKRKTKQIKQEKNIFKNLIEAQKSEQERRWIDRGKRRRWREKQKIEERKAKIVEKYGTEPTICYHYYLWNAVDYVGEKVVRESFESIKGQGDEIIVGDYSSTDNTPQIAEEYGFKVVNVEKTEGILFHESKIVNKVVFESKSNFIVDLNIHTTYPKNMDKFFRNWLQNNDITKKQLAARGLLYTRNNKIERRYSASMLVYKPFLLEARGYDENTYYSFGTTPYALSLILNFYKLVWDNQPLDMVHKFHGNLKFPSLKNVFKVGEMGRAHKLSTEHGESLIDKLIDNFDEGIKQVKNSYW